MWIIINSNVYDHINKSTSIARHIVKYFLIEIVLAALLKIYCYCVFQRSSQCTATELSLHLPGTYNYLVYANVLGGVHRSVRLTRTARGGSSCEVCGVGGSFSCGATIGTFGGVVCA